MKKILLICLSLLLALSLAACSAQEQPVTEPEATPAESPAAQPTEEPVKELFSTISFDESTPVTVDLNGDGVDETVSVTSVEGKEEDGVWTDSTVTLTVTNAQGETSEFSSEFNYLISAYVTDMNPEDSAKEILFNIDYWSDDNEIWIFRYDGKNLNQLIEREGVIKKVNGNELTISERVDCFGTWFCDILYALNEKGELNEVPGQTRTVSTEMNPVQANRDVAVELLSESGTWEEATLAPGASITVTGTDLTGFVFFTDENGTSGRIPVTFDGYSVKLADGTSDYEAFENLPYCD